MKTLFTIYKIKLNEIPKKKLSSNVGFLVLSKYLSHTQTVNISKTYVDSI